MFPLDPLYMFLTLLSALGGGVHCNFFLASVILSDEDEDVAVDDPKSPAELLSPYAKGCSSVC